MSQASLPLAPQDDRREELHEPALLAVLPATVLAGVTLTLVAEAYAWPLRVSVFGSALIVFPLLSWALLHLWYRPSLWLIVVGYLALSLAAVRWLGDPAAIGLVPASIGLASILFGPAHGLGFALLTSVLVLAGGGVLGAPAVLSRLLAVGAIWAVQGLAWAALGYASRAVGWWSSSYERMRQLLEEARAQRVELKQMQEDLVQANLELARVSERLRAMGEVAEEARRAKEEFVANVSHELRTPLNMIIGFSEMIVKAPRVYGGDLPPKLLADIEVILSSSRHLAGLVDDVLDLSQVDTGRMALTREWASLQEIVEAAAKAVTPLFESKGLSLAAEVPGNLPLLYCDRIRIRQVILNLLSNAGRFAERGGANLRVAREGSGLVVSVTDTGPGIAPEDQARIFEPFAQADSSIRRRYGGSGLGLAISKRFVELHNGKMWLRSEVGKGTTFCFSIPIEDAAPHGPADFSRWFSPYHEHEARTRPSKAPRPRPAPRFVVMEAGDTLRRLLSRYHGEAEVVSARTLGEAVHEVSRLPAQALIVNEPSLQRQLTQPEGLPALPYGTPVIMCWLPGRKEAAERLGLMGYLMKPVEREALLATLDGLPGPVRRILVVDDEPEALQLYARILSSAGRGYRILRAPTGRRALTLLRERRPDLVLLDLVMPGMDGYAVLREKGLDPRIGPIPVVALSAQDPTRGPIASDFLTISRSGGLYLQDLLRSIDAISEILAPPDRLDPGQPGTPPG